MYFYVYNGQIYWGRHQILPPHRNVMTWIFRNKPVRFNRIYISGNISFIAVPALQSGRYMILLSHPELNEKGDYQVYQIVEGRCFLADKNGFRECGGTERHDTARWEFKNMFKNRLKEYRGRYFLAIEKHSRYA